ncbi:hypothetical protein JL475_00415 [Streptomyces sp. M2CJ-2]|uniref:hypothetical protein n=1 Tax=Streptomyces sp. M2CJ-2 TaxID=2803948 RepID=UPI001924E5EF|nr:hypothetical protein [Streptomyces sp. M2CJ-2]MBL3664509.1 hypothetical protein [Streptomyces sp. M2CJ-2]
MSAIDLAITIAGTAVVLAPIDPQALRDTEPTPAATPTLPACTALLLAHADSTLAARVRAALGMPGRQMREDEGETARRVSMWSQYELNALYERVDGTVTTRTVQRSTHGGESTWEATEITVSVDLPGVGAVEIFTDWDEATGGRDLPLMQAIPDATLIPA